VANVVFDKRDDKLPIDELIAVSALDFRPEWNEFLELITPDIIREKFLSEYKRLKVEGITIKNEEELDKLTKEYRHI
jgi:hypothetical protein